MNITIKANWPSGAAALGMPGYPAYNMVIMIDSRFAPLPTDKALHDELRAVLTKYGAKDIQFSEKILCNHGLRHTAALKQAVVDVLRRHYERDKR